ncbi:hypothetical protein BV20DRAFT_973697 [Pilatotrama ljubarskyi]|nr:hypothetical protein BV20DRAFT_973697 [Pilatotrama ljubarskyi]
MLRASANEAGQNNLPDVPSGLHTILSVRGATMFTTCHDRDRPLGDTRCIAPALALTGGRILGTQNHTTATAQPHAGLIFSIQRVRRTRGRMPGCQALDRAKTYRERSPRWSSAGQGVWREECSASATDPGRSAPVCVIGVAAAQYPCAGSMTIPRTVETRPCIFASRIVWWWRFRYRQVSVNIRLPFSYHPERPFEWFTSKTMRS